MSGTGLLHCAIGYKASHWGDSGGPEPGSPEADTIRAVGSEERSGVVRLVPSALVVLGASQLAVGIWMVVSPSTFFSFAGFGARNDHFIRDVATLYLALGVVLLVSARRPSWRVPVLTFAVVQYGLHLVNHLADVGEGHPGWVGPVNAAGVALGLAAFAAVLLASLRSRAR